MNKIYCIMGKSASGKNSIYHNLLMLYPSLLKPYVTYTTRLRRVGERTGIDYNFVNLGYIKKLRNENKIIEEKTYTTTVGNWIYAVVDDGQCDFSQHSYLIIGTLQTFEKLKNFFTSERVEPIYIEASDGERLIRAIERERIEKKPNYSEICRRFLADEIDFSEEKIRKANIENRFYNANFDTCIKEIIEAMHF